MIRKTILATLLLFSMMATTLFAATLPQEQTQSLAVKKTGANVSCKSPIRYDGLGIAPGKEHALAFGTGLISFPEKSQRVVAIHRDGKDLFFTLLSATGPQIMHSLYRNGRWQAPALAAFSNVGLNTEPSISPDGNTLFFISTRPPSKGTDIWKAVRSGDGWSEPIRLGDAINSDGYEWHPQATANGDLYFAAADRGDSHGDADLYVSRFEHGAYLPAENLGPQINTSAAEWDGYVSPRGDYLIFKSDRPGGYGGKDMYISVCDDKGSWSVPKNLGPSINTADDEDSGDVTPDGRYLIFARSKPGAQFWQMYWIDVRAVLPTRNHQKCP